MAEQMGRSPAIEQNVCLDIVSEPHDSLEGTPLTVMDGHAVLLPAVPLVHPAGVSERLLVGQWCPGEAAQRGRDQADVAPPAVLDGHIGDSIGVGAAHQTAVLPVLAVGAGQLVGGWKLTVHPDVSLQVSQAGEHLRPAWSEQKLGHRVH